MGRASTTSKDFPSGPEDGKGTLEAAGREWSFQHVSIGNPQCAIVVGEELEDLDLGEIGPGIEAHDLFPNRTNVSFLAIDGSRVRARIYERGVGETLSSGTGASGAAVTAFLLGAASPIVVELDGGELAGPRRRRPGRSPDRLGRAGLRRRALTRADHRARRAGRLDFPAHGDRRPVKPPGGDASLHVPGTGATDRRQARRRHRRDQPRDRRPRRTHLPLRRRSDEGGGRRPHDPPVPEQPRPRRVPPSLRRLLPGPLRGRDRPRDRGDPGDRRQGVHLQPLLRLPRPRRRRPRLRPRLPRLHRRSDPHRRHPRAAAAGPRAGFRAGPRRRPSRDRRPCSTDVPQLPEQPDRRRRPRRLLRDGRTPSPAEHEILVVHDNAYSETTYDGYVAPSFLATPGRRRSGSRSSPSPRATT